MKLLLMRGANINARDNVGGTALMDASAYGETGIASALLDKGASIDARNRDGYTALMWAANNGQIVVAKLLIDKGAMIPNQFPGRALTGDHN